MTFLEKKAEMINLFDTEMAKVKPERRKKNRVYAKRKFQDGVCFVSYIHTNIEGTNLVRERKGDDFPMISNL